MLLCYHNMKHQGKLHHFIECEFEIFVMISIKLCHFSRCFMLTNHIKCIMLQLLSNISKKYIDI